MRKKLEEKLEQLKAQREQAIGQANHITGRIHELEEILAELPEEDEATGPHPVAEAVCR